MLVSSKYCEKKERKKEQKKQDTKNKKSLPLQLQDSPNTREKGTKLPNDINN